jgi:capsular polysaccharide biosynthesis protein
MEVKLYFRMLQRSWWIIVITTLATVAAALVASYFTAPTYRATARFIVSPSPALITGGSNLLNSLSTLDKRSIITTYAEILNSDRIYSRDAQFAAMNEASLVGYSYNAVALPDANIIEFSVMGPDPDTVYMLTNGIGQHAVEYVHSPLSSLRYECTGCCCSSHHSLFATAGAKRRSCTGGGPGAGCRPCPGA